MPSNQQDQKSRGYFATAGAALPLYAAKGVIADLPKKSIEEAAALRTGGDKRSAFKLLLQGAKGRGALTAGAGALAASATAPIFLKGVQGAGSDDRWEKAKGIGLIAGSGAAFNAAKGKAEDVGSRYMSGRAARKTNYALARTLLKTPAGIALGLTIAGGRKKSEKDGKPQGFASKILKPAAVGAAGSILTEAASDIFSKQKITPKRFKGMLIGGVIGGGITGAGAGYIADRLLKKSEK